MVAADGTIDPASIQLRNASHPPFQQSTWQIVRELRFTPAVRGGRPEAAPMTGWFRFDGTSSAAEFRPAGG
jgi:hypothetical protein